jgi:hypothetical protein
VPGADHATWTRESETHSSLRSIEGECWVLDGDLAGPFEEMKQVEVFLVIVGISEGWKAFMEMRVSTQIA